MEDLQSAVEAVKSRKLSFRKASIKYGVPVITINDRVNNKVDDMARAGRPTILTTEMETKTSGQNKKAPLQGFGISKKMLRIKVARLVRRLKLKTPFEKRHTRKRLDTRIWENLLVNWVWKMLRRKFATLMRPASRSHKIQQRSLLKPVVKNIPGRVGNSRDNVSVLAAVNAAGDAIPPMVVVKGKTAKRLECIRRTVWSSGYRLHLPAACLDGRRIERNLVSGPLSETLWTRTSPAHFA
ncbi:hypothetical protein KUTeg_006858 [Tegillarca granosa]|uniref:HTH psq-type domain-containing protein n=1 Tax=Tegillarca granosa TaxID=220873 RepID=A0ABQ9FBJ4_TEGGR|nr:hypothetical protein KUTeg_006858 [Tegillarca granosa]